MLVIENLTVEVENKMILKDFNLTIEDGTSHVIMGPNGVGKSTLTRVIMGDPNYKIIKGDILYNGESIINLKTDERAKKGIFLAMQNPLEIDGISNSEFLKTALSSKENRNVNLYSFMKKMDKVKEELKMPNEMVHRSVNKGFSGGEKKKNEIFQMKILEPELVLLDEIDSGVDVDSLKVLGENINNYKKENKRVSLLMITHYTHLLKYVNVDYVHILKGGKIIKTGDYSLAKKIEDNGFNFDDISMSSVIEKGDISE